MMEAPRLVSREEMQKLTQRVNPGAYYTNGWDLVQVKNVGVTAGCIEYEVCDQGLATRCADILRFRKTYWRVK
jgi:hypothetical protein